MEARAGTQANGEDRLVLEVSGVLSYQVFVLESPPRLVVVLPGHEWRLPLYERLPFSKLLKSYRYERFGQVGGRVVVATERPVRVKRSFFLPKRPDQNIRIVVDVEGIDENGISNRVDEDLSSILSVATVASPSSTLISAPIPLPATFPKTARHHAEAAHRHVIVLDAGHGGVDPGAQGGRGTKEKDVVLEFVHELAEQLRAHGGYRVVLTREDDRGIALRSRLLRARESLADLFVSIHADALGQSDVGGFSVYTLSEVASDEEAAALAAQENAADILIGVDLNREDEEVRSILIDLSQRETKNLSVKFAQVLLKRVGEKTPLLSKSHRFAGFRVLKAPDVPSVLVELGFLTNREDESRIASPVWRKMVARQFVLAMGDFFAAPTSE